VALLSILGLPNSIFQPFHGRQFHDFIQSSSFHTVTVLSCIRTTPWRREEESYGSRRVVSFTLWPL
jgi:hypothetical protein